MLNTTVFALLIGAVGVLTVAGGVAMGWERRLHIAIALSIPELFVSGVSIPISQVSYIWLGVCGLFDPALRRSANIGVYIIALLAGCSFVSVLWSADRLEAVSDGVRFIEFATLLVYAVRASKGGEASIRKLVLILSPWLVIESILTILFRVFPNVEQSFLQSALGDLLIGPTASGLYSGIPNNVLDPAKAGGLFVNGNVASMFCGVAMTLCFAVSAMRWSRWLNAVGLLCWIAVFFSGSKTGLALGVILPLLVVLVASLSRPRAVLFVVPIGLFALCVVLVAPKIINTILPGYLQASSNSLATREGLWSGAAQLFLQHPLRGLGYGGWALVIGEYVDISTFPPHNLVLAAWSNSGTLAALLILVYIVWSVRLGARRVSETLSSGPLASLWVLAGLVWIFIHGMGDNTGVYGDWRSMSLIAVLVGAASVPGRRVLLDPLTTRMEVDPVFVGLSFSR